MKLVQTLLLVGSAAAFVPGKTPLPRTGDVRMEARHQEAGVERRNVLVRGVGLLPLVVGLGLGKRARAEPLEVPLVRDKMGGVLEPFSDIQKGVKLFRPSGWNQFDGSPTTFLVKWSDIVNRDEQLVLNSTPVKSSTTSVTALGPVDEVAKRLATSRKAKVVEAKERVTDGVDFYEFEFESEDGMTELYELAVNKGKLWSLSATAASKRWPKRRDMYRNVLGSFVPKL